MLIPTLREKHLWCIEILLPTRRIGVNLSNYREEDVKLPLLFSRRAQIGDAFREPIRGGYARYILSTTPAAFSRPVGIHSAVPSLE
jgi:hypothetical protein